MMDKGLQGVVSLLNAPSCCINKRGIRAGVIKITGELEADIEICHGIYISKDIEDEYPKKYFDTAIQGMSVWAPLFLFGGYLPTKRAMKLLVLAKDDAPANDEWNYKRVKFTIESTVASLYRNAFHYKYDPDTDAYIRLTKEKAVQNALKIEMQKNIMEIGGDPYDRIADLARITLFLLSRTQLTESERELLAPLLGHAAGIENLTDVFNRERHIQDYVAHVKADPVRYLNE